MADKKSRKTESGEQFNGENIAELIGNSENAEVVKPDKTAKAALTPEERRKKIWKEIKYWAILNVGVLFISFGVYMFEGPNNFLIGGVSGISIFLASVVTPHVEWLTYDIFIWGINAILIIVGFIFLGKDIGIKTVYCALMYSLEVYVFELIYKPAGPISGETGLLEAIFAVVMSGIGQAIIFYNGATSGGTDIIAMIVKKYKKINIGFAIIAVDFVIATLSFFPIFSPDFGPKMGMLCIFGVIMRAFAIDGIIENIAKTKYVTIITSQPEIAAGIIINDLNRGYTKYAAQGGFTGEDRTIIITVCQKGQAVRLKEKVSKEDPTSFTIITDANEILGNGFAAKF